MPPVVHDDKYRIEHVKIHIQACRISGRTQTHPEHIGEVT